MQKKQAGAARSSLKTTIHLRALLEVTDGAHAPSWFKFTATNSCEWLILLSLMSLLWPKAVMILMSLLNSTTNWKLAIDIKKATINSNAWKVVGANHAPSEINSPINLNDLSWKVIETVFAVIDLEYPNLLAVCTPNLLAVCTPSKIGLHLESTISLWRRLTLKWAQLLVKSCLWFAGLHLLWFGQDLKWLLIPNQLMQQPTEMW